MSIFMKGLQPSCPCIGTQTDVQSHQFVNAVLRGDSILHLRYASGSCFVIRELMGGRGWKAPA